MKTEVGSRESRNLEWWYIRSCAAILLLTGIIKIFSVTSPTAGMSHVDPVFGIRYQLLMAVLGLLELITVPILLYAMKMRRALEFVLFLGAAFSLYHLVWWITGSPGLCPCLGNLFKMSKWMQDQQNVLVASLICYFLFGAGFLRFRPIKSSTQVYAPLV